MGNWYNILVAVDAMESSISAVQYVGRVAGNITDVSICLLHVYPEPPPDFNTKGGVREVYQAQRIGRAEQIFQRCLEILITAGIMREAIYCTNMASNTAISAAITLSSTARTANTAGLISITICTCRNGLSPST